MNFIFAPLYVLFGYCMNFLMGILNDQYFLSIIIFVILTRLILLPFNMKQQKTMAKTSRIQPKIAKIQKKYANTGNLSQKQMADNRQKMNEEMQALYARENHNPMNMGCGPMIFQMVFLFGIIGIIYYPLQYVLNVSTSELEILTKAVGQIMDKVTYPELTILSEFTKISEIVGDKVSPETMANIESYAKGMTLGGFDLTKFPKMKLEPLVLVPVFSFITSFLSSLYSTMAQKKNNPAMAQQNGQMTMMMLMMPFFSLFIAFKVPAAVGLYWIISNVVTTLQQVLLNQFYPAKKITAKSMIEATIERRSKEKSIITANQK